MRGSITDPVFHGNDQEMTASMDSGEKYALGHSDVVGANRAFYDDVADRYLDLESYAYGKDIVASVRHNLRVAALESESPSRFLDFGCGSGFLSKIAAEEGLFENGTGIDVSPVQVALFNSQMSGRPYEALVCDGTRTPFEDASFSVVAGYSVLHHFFDPFLALREAARVLSPGGVMYFDFEPNEDFRRSFSFAVKLRRLAMSGQKGKDKTLEEVAEFHNNFTLGLNSLAIASSLELMGFTIIELGQRFPSDWSGRFSKFLSGRLGFPSPLFFVVAKKNVG